jgi:hypothetical protein
VAVAEVVALCSQVEKTVHGRMKAAQQKQTAEYNARKRNRRSSTTVSVGDRILKKNVRKATRQGENAETRN